MRTATILPLVVALVLGSAFIVNEWSYGALSETMGLGTHHLLSPPHRCDGHDVASHGVVGRHEGSHEETGCSQHHNRTGG